MNDTRDDNGERPKFQLVELTDGTIALGTTHPYLGFLPILQFRGWDEFKPFLDGLFQTYEENNPRVPAVFLDAFKEENNG